VSRLLHDERQRREDNWLLKAGVRGPALKVNSPPPSISEYGAHAKPPKPASGRPPPGPPGTPRPSRDLPPVFRISSFVDDRAVPAKAARTPHRDTRPDHHKPHSPSLSDSRKD
jgi:hypothetical protein